MLIPITHHPPAVNASYVNINRRGYPDQISVGYLKNPTGKTKPQVKQYVRNGVMHNAFLVENAAGLRAIFANQEKSVSAWAVGRWEQTAFVALSRTKAGKPSKPIHAPNPDAVVPEGAREITIMPKHPDPARRHFHFKDNLEIVDRSRSYTLIWVADPDGKPHCWIY